MCMTHMPRQLHVTADEVTFPFTFPKCDRWSPQQLDCRKFVPFKVALAISGLPRGCLTCPRGPALYESVSDPLAASQVENDSH